MSNRGPRNPRDHSLPEVTIEVLRLKDPGRMIVRTLSRTYKGCLTHHLKNRSEYCPGRDACALHTFKAVWKGYCCVERWSQAGNVWEPFVLEISESLDQDLYGRFDAGQIWEIQKHVGKDPKKNNGKYTGKFWEQRDPSTFPPAFDMRPALRCMYHVAEVVLDLDNPMPRRIVLPVSKDAGPRAPGDVTLPAEERPRQSIVEAIKERDRAKLLNGVGEMPKS